MDYGTCWQISCLPPFGSRYASIPFHMVPLEVPWHCNLGAALLMAPQLYWFSLICRGALRLFTGSSRSQRPHASTAATKERQTDGNTLPQPSNGYSARSTEPELATHWVEWRGEGGEGKKGECTNEYVKARKLLRRLETSSIMRKKETKKKKSYGRWPQIGLKCLCPAVNLKQLNVWLPALQTLQLLSS